MSHHRSLRSAGALCLSLLMVLGLCAGRSRLGPICVPGQRSLENFDPTVVGTGLTVDPVCTETSEIKLEATVEPPLQVILETWRNITGQNIYWGYVCEGNGTTVEGNGTTVDGNGAAVEGNFSTHLHNGAITGDWTTVLVDSSQSQSLAVGDRCKFFGCYEYIVNTGEGSLLNPIQLHYVSNFNGTSCVVDKDECSDGTSQCEHECINMMTGTANSYQCTCRKGFSLSEDQHNCTDVDECAVEELNNCDQMCTVTGDGWYNCSCEDGFTLDQDNHTCNDINECATNGTTLCELTGSDCNNTLGSYQCICQEGYEFNELHQLCEDIDECATDGAALCQQQCNNLDGGYNCSCFTWYLPDGPYNCTEIDVCMELAVECGGHSDCVNSPEESQGYRCECQSGYERNGNSCKLRGLVHVYWVVPVLLVVLMLLLTGCVCLLRHKYRLNKLDLQKRYNILFKYQVKKEQVDPSYNPVGFNPARKVSYTFSLVSTLETYEYPVIVHEPDDDKESDTSSVRHLYSPSGQLMARDDDHGKRELSAIIEGSEDGISIGRTTEEHFTEIGSEYTDRKELEISEYPSYLAQAHEDHDIVWQNPNSTPYRLNELSVCNGYIKDVQTDLPYPDSPLSDKEPSSSGYIEDSCYSCVDSARLLESEHVADAGLIGGGEHRDTLTQLESHTGSSPDGTLETTPQHTRAMMMTEEYALNDPPSDSGISVGLLENGTNVAPLSRFPERAKPALNDGYIPSTISTTSSGYGSEASTSGYKSRFMSISSYATDTSAAPNSGYIPSTFSTASSGYASDSGVSRYKHGSLASELSYETPHMPHFDNGWSNGDGVTDIGLCESPVTHTGKISNVSGYVTESLEPVPRYPLNKHLDLHSKVSVDSSLSTATPDACRDSVFHDDHLTEHLEQGLNAEHECSKGSGVTHNGYIPYPGHEEAVMQDPSNLTDELTLHCDIPNTQHCADAGAADSHSHTSPEITTRRTARTTATSEEEDCVDGSHLHLDSRNDKIASQDYVDSGDNTCFKAPAELFPNELSLKSGYIDPSQLQLQSSVHVPEYTPIEPVQF